MQVLLGSSEVNVDRIKALLAATHCNSCSIAAEHNFPEYLCFLCATSFYKLLFHICCVLFGHASFNHFVHSTCVADELHSVRNIENEKYDLMCKLIVSVLVLTIIVLLHNRL